MADLEYLLALNMIPDIGFIRFNNLISRFGAAEGIFAASRAELEEVESIGPKIAENILNFDRDKEVKRELEAIRERGVNVISCLEEGYPVNLKQIYDPPIILYVKGDLAPEDRFAVAIVGSRNASRYGISTAERLGYELASSGLTVVSGLARGIDAWGHRGALKAKGRTLAVLGNGLGEVYPPEHSGLAEDIVRCGAVVSEFPMGTPPLKDNFPRRNRVISGLSLGTVVVEAARNSGALITADFALEQGRELFAVPGQARSATSFGTNRLIRQGAKLVEAADDVIEELDCVIRGHLKTEALAAPSSLRDAEGRERNIFEAMGGDAVTVDEIVDSVNLPAAEILDCLTKLQLRGLVEQLPGKLFARKGGR